MDINKKNRSDLKSYFVKNSIPTQSNFSELIEGMLNQKDDGIVKLSGDPLSIEAAGDSTGLQKVINFYTKLQNANPDWSLQLNPRTDPNNANTFKAGFCIADGLSTPRLFIDKNSGNVGIGTITPNAKLDINGNLTVTGNIASTGTLVVTGAITPSAGNTETNGIMFPKDPGGGGSDAAWIRYYARSGEACTLEIAITNDADDHIALMPSGNVGIGTNTPKAKLDINGNLAVTGTAALSSTLAVTGATTLSNVTLGGFTGADADEWPNVTWFRDTANNWDEGLIKHTSTKGFFKRSGFGIHLHSSRDWTFFSSGWDALLGIEGGTGNTKIKGNLTAGGNIGIGTTNSVAKLDIAQAARTGIHPAAIKGLYITGDFGGDADGIEFRHSNGSQGIGFGYNTIYATGSNANQDLNLKAKGTGSINVTGYIKSPMWKVTQVFNSTPGGLPLKSAVFTTSGGTLMIIASGSGWKGVGGIIGMSILLDDNSAAPLGEVKGFTNEINSHKAFTCNALIKTGVAAGSHTITLSALSATNTDYNDFFNVTVLEFPF